MVQSIWYFHSRKIRNPCFPLKMYVEEHRILDSEAWQRWICRNMAFSNVRPLLQSCASHGSELEEYIAGKRAATPKPGKMGQIRYNSWSISCIKQLGRVSCPVRPTGGMCIFTTCLSYGTVMYFSRPGEWHFYSRVSHLDSQILSSSLNLVQVKAGTSSILTISRYPM